MDFRLTLCLGFATLGVNQGQFKVTARRINSISRLAGSYHVLEMGRHFDDYVENDHRPLLITAPYLAQFPALLAHQPLDIKMRSSGVTANIGEAIGALVARNSFDLSLREVVHLTTRSSHRGYKSPDYLFDFANGLPTWFNSEPRLAAISNIPRWWPVESKARAGSPNQAIRDAFEQLCAYWWSAAMSGVLPGFGIVINTLYARNPAEIRVHVFVPTNVVKFRELLRRIALKGYTYEMFRDHVHKRAPHGLIWRCFLGN